MQTLGVVFTSLNRFSADKKKHVSHFFLILFNIFQFHQNRRRTPREVPLSDNIILRVEGRYSIVKYSIQLN